MAIFARKDIAHQAVRGLIDHQRFPRQGASLHLTQHFEASLTRFNTVAIQAFHAIPQNQSERSPSRWAISGRNSAAL